MKSLRRMAGFVQPYRWIAILLLITVVLPVTMELIVPRALRFMIDQGIATGDMNTITRWASIMLAAALAGALATLGQGVCRAQLSQGLAYDMRNRMFAHIQTFSFANLDHMQTGQLMTRLSSDVDLVRGFLSNGVSLFLRWLLMVLGSLVMMFVIDWQLTLIIIVLVFLAVLVIRTVMRLAQPLFVEVQRKLAALNTSVQENLAGVQVVKAFVRERFEIGRFGEYNNDYMEQNIKVGRLMAVAAPLLAVLTNLGVVVVVWFGGVNVIGGRLSVGEFVAFNNYLLIGMGPLMQLGNMLTMVSRAETSAQRVWEVLDTEPVVKAAASPFNADRMRGQVTFKDVDFCYDGELDASGNLEIARATGGENVLEGISFAVEPGQRFAILGATGSGKSSLVNLVPRFYDVCAGQILIDGVDTRQWDPLVLRRNIGVVLQQTTLFSGTVRQNIAYGRPDAPLDEVIAAAKIAQAHDFIIRMPQGYDSLVEERGANLSGGQKQRITIARALLITPGILILDDSTSAVDMETEAEMQAALDELRGERTTFIVAQRISSVVNADQIIVLEHGRIAAAGNHQQLLASSPIYQEIYQSQLGNGDHPEGLVAQAVGP
jgi:ATP-binding cassette subfamily B protein